MVYVKRPHKTADLLDLSNPFFKSKISSFSEIIPLSETRGYLPHRSIDERNTFLARKIIKAFWECVMEDFLEHDTILLTLSRPMIYLKISFLRNFNSKYFYYRERGNGKNYRVFIIVSKYLSDKVNSYFFSKSSVELKQTLGRYIDKGYSWT